MVTTVQIPTGSLVGLCALVLVVGVVLGRSGRFMRKVGQMHAKVHTNADAAAASRSEAKADQRVQTVVVVDPSGAVRDEAGRWLLDLEESENHREVVGSVAAGELGREVVTPELASKTSRSSEGLPVNGATSTNTVRRFR